MTCKLLWPADMATGGADDGGIGGTEEGGTDDGGVPEAGGVLVGLGGVSGLGGVFCVSWISSSCESSKRSCDPPMGLNPWPNDMGITLCCTATVLVFLLLPAVVFVGGVVMVVVPVPVLVPGRFLAAKRQSKTFMIRLIPTYRQVYTYHPLPHHKAQLLLITKVALVKNVNSLWPH